VVIEAPARATVGTYQRFDGEVGDSDEGCRLAFHDHSHRIPCPCLYLGLQQDDATVTASDLELALNRSADFPNEPACVCKAMVTEREAASGQDFENVDHVRSSGAGIGH
jgi:hypothetical protein